MFITVKGHVAFGGTHEFMLNINHIIFVDKTKKAIWFSNTTSYLFVEEGFDELLKKLANF